MHALLQPRNSQLELVPKVGDHAQIEIGLGYIPCDSRFEAERQGLLGDRLGALGVASAPAQESQCIERPVPVAGWGVAGIRQRLFEPGAAFLKVSAAFPETKQCRRAPQCGSAAFVS